MIEQLACKLGRNDEGPNIELAERLVQNNDADGVAEIIEGFKGDDKAVASDCIKVLYEAGARKPELVCGYADDFILGLCSRNNRLVWGSMMALARIVELAPRQIYEKLDEVKSAYEKGSTITVDNSVSVFAGLCKQGGDYAEATLPLLLGHLQKCRPKEIPQHAERMSVCFGPENARAFIAILEERNPCLAAPQQARVNRLLKKLYGMSESID